MKTSNLYAKRKLVRSVLTFFLLTFLTCICTKINAQTVTAIGSAASASATNTIASFTAAAGTSRVLIVTASDAASTNITGVTFNGSTMLEKAEVTDGTAVDAIYTLSLGTSASSTTGSIVVTSTNGTHSSKYITARVFDKVNQTTPLGGIVSAMNGTVPSASTLSVTSATGDLVFDIFDSWKSATPGSVHTAGSGQTIMNTITAVPISIGGFGWWTTSTKTGAASVSMSRSTTNHEALIHIAGSIKWDGTVLPITLLSFNAVLQNNNTLLSWKVADAINFSHFEVERSCNSNDFEKIGSIAVSGNNAIQDYKFNDALSVVGTQYYRLKLIDIGGTFKYSNTIVIKNGEVNSFGISPNPATSQLFVNGLKDKNVAYIITNAAGQTVLKGNLASNKPIDIESLNKGLYYILIDKKVLQFLKQ